MLWLVLPGGTECAIVTLLAMENQNLTVAQITAVVFDVGGVIADWNPAYAYDERIPDPEQRSFFLREVCGKKWLAALNRGTTFEAAIRKYQAKYPEWQREIAAYPMLWRKMIAGLVPGMKEIFKDVGRAGAGVYVFTNHPAEPLSTTLDAVPFLKDADGMFVSGLERLVKPDPKAFETIAARFGLTPGSTLLVDDERDNVSAARRMGWEAVLFTESGELRRELVERGVLRSGASSATT
jgi:2-haloacid dehalogenase